MKKIKNLRDLWDDIKSNNMHVMGIPDREGKGDRIFEKIMTINFPNLRKNKSIFKKLNLKRSTLRSAREK